MKRVARKLVVIKENGPIKELDNICGPLLSPTRVSVKKIALLIKNKKEVWECDPSDPKNETKRVLLNTVEKAIANNFGGPINNKEIHNGNPKTPIIPQIDAGKEKTAVVTESENNSTEKNKAIEKASSIVISETENVEKPEEKVNTNTEAPILAGLTSNTLNNTEVKSEQPKIPFNNNSNKNNGKNNKNNKNNKK